MLRLNVDERFSSSNWFLCIACLTICLASSSIIPAQSPQTPGQWSQFLTRERQAISRRIQEANAGQQSTVAAREKQYLQVLDATYAQHLQRLDSLERLKKDVAEAESTLEALDDYEPDEPKPYSFLTLERLRDAREQEQSSRTALNTELSAARHQVELARESVQRSLESTSSKTEQPKSSSTSDSPSDSTDKGANGSEREEPLPKSLANAPRIDPHKLAEARLRVRTLEVDIARLRIQLSKLLDKQLGKKIAVLEKNVKFSKHDRDAGVAAIEQLVLEAKSKRQQASSELDDFSSIGFQLASQATAETERNQIVEAVRIGEECIQSRIVLLDEMLEHLDTAIDLWKHRYEIANESSHELKNVRSWSDDNDTFIEQLEDSVASLDQKRASLRTLSIRVSDGNPLALKRAPAATTNNKSAEAADASARSDQSDIDSDNDTRAKTGVDPVKHESSAQTASIVVNQQIRQLDDLCINSEDQLRSLLRSARRFESELTETIKKLEGKWNIGWLDFATGCWMRKSPKSTTSQSLCGASSCWSFWSARVSPHRIMRVASWLATCCLASV